MENFVLFEVLDYTLKSGEILYAAAVLRKNRTLQGAIAVALNCSADWNQSRQETLIR